VSIYNPGQRSAWNFRPPLRLDAAKMRGGWGLNLLFTNVTFLNALLCHSFFGTHFMECDQALKNGQQSTHDEIMSETKEMTKPKVGEISWNELVTTNTKSAGNFYSKLFGWQPTPYTPKGAPAGGPPYTLFKLDPDTMGEGGMMQTQHPEMPTQWIPYVVVDDVDAALAKAVKLGAKTLTPVMSIGEVGRIAVIHDPQGATIGLHECPD
jgi:predicted enzyme related to lactoylglutathione lyase